MANICDASDTRNTSGFHGRWPMRRSVSIVVAAMLLIAVRGFAIQSGAPAALRPGASLTLLPSGQVLVVGGYNATSQPTADLLLIGNSGNITQLPASLHFARAGHSATVLPDGHVLIFGGFGPDSKLAVGSELLDTNSWTSETVSGLRLLPRAYHTATVLTDGTVVVIGGVQAGGELGPEIQVWDYRTNTVLAYGPGLSIPRQRHVATLQPNGSVLIGAGIDRFGRAVGPAEEYDPAAHRFSFATSGASSSAMPVMEESIPANGADNVSIAGILAVRFGGPVSVAKLTGSTVTLHAPDESLVPASVTGVEGGRLLFVVPFAPLNFQTTYRLVLDGVSDNVGNLLSATTIQFTTQANPGDTSDEQWIPAPDDFNGHWHSHTGPSEWQKLPALRAKTGITAISGQVLKLNGRPLSHVLLQIGNKKAFSDLTGRFLISGIPQGRHVMVIDGRPGNHDDAVYGRYEVGVDVTAGKTNVLNYTVWMTKLDLTDAVSIPSPTLQEIVVTTPRLPGLALHLPANTTITDADGHPVRQLTITPIPLDKPPFPLPLGVQVPIYFTIQPGGAYIRVQGTSGPKGAWLTYPNTHHSPPGTEFAFWNYDADSKGWYVYGHGQVDKSATSVIPDPGVLIYELTGAMVGTAGGPFPFPPVARNGPKDGDPVDLSTGLFTYEKLDLMLPDTLPIVLKRSYRNSDNVSRAFGIGTTISYDIYMSGDQHPYSFQELIQPDGSRIRFNRISTGSDFTDAVYLHSSGQGSFYGATIQANFNNDFGATWALRMKDGTTLWFPDSDSIPNYRRATPVGITDRYGNEVQLSRDPNGNLLQVTSPNGRFIKFTYDGENRVTQALDNIGRTVQYHYDSAGRLQTVTDVAGGITRYTYDTLNNLLTIQDARGITYLTNEYDSFGRVTRQTMADQGTYLFNWNDTGGLLANTSQDFILIEFDSIGFREVIPFRNCAQCSEGYPPVISSVDVTDPRGFVRHVTFDSMGHITTDTRAVNQPEQQTYTYQWNADNSLKAAIDLLGRETDYTYDVNLNTTAVTRLAGTDSPLTSFFSYEPVFSQLTSATDPLGHTTNLTVDGKGNTTHVTDPLGNGTAFSFNVDGIVASVTDGAGNTTLFEYNGGDLVSITDPLGQVSTRFTDPAGRVISTTDAMGNTVKTQYNSLNLISAVTDPLGNQTLFSYDANGNLIDLTDALNHTTSWAYDNMDRVLTRTDPLQRHESFSYDLNGNFVSSTDRKSQVTSLTYDPLNRLTLAGYNTVVNEGITSYESTVGYTYDAGNRMTQAVDSAGGTITEVYDNLDRLTSETTPQGQISYGYDLAGRRGSMTVSGQPQVTYTYDNANRLTQIAQGTSTVAFSYDTVNRRSTLTLSNGVNMSYTYDNNSRVTGMTYKFNSNILGDLTYSYDSLGRRTQVGGSFARTGLPGTVSSATYDVANELTNWNGTPISYDLNGNMLSDGANTFSWNARNQVATLNSVSLQYDGFGRRTRNSQSTSFLFDGANAAQELAGSAVTANLLSGGIDEAFTRADSSGTFTQLKDALGSTIALVDASGNLVTQYSFDPFGNTTVSGTTNANAFQYTGRENEGNGLYFYRARYYSPVLSRFISEDPLGVRGSGSNFYAYVFDDPVGSNDPSGLWSTDAHNQIIWNALHPCGVTSHDIDMIEQGSKYIDNNYQDPEYSYMHAMSDGSHNQSAGDAQNRTADFIVTRMKSASNLLIGGNRDNAMFLFGQAMHPVMDYTSPAHTDASGNPIPWCGLTGGCSHPFQHGGDSDMHNPFSLENLNALNAHPEIQAFEDLAIRNWFTELTGQTCMSGRK